MSVRIRRGGALGAVSINSNSLNPVQNGLLFDLSAKYYGIADKVKEYFKSIHRHVLLLKSMLYSTLF